MCARNDIIHHSHPIQHRPLEIALVDLAGPNPQEEVPPWPPKLHLLQLRRLRTDPRLCASFTAFLLSYCSSVENLVIDASPRYLVTWTGAVSRKKASILTQFPNLRTLDIVGHYRALQWCNEKVNLRPPEKLLKVTAPFGPDGSLSKLVNTRSSCRLDVTVRSALDDPP